MSVLVVMTTGISGTRNEQEWPPAGGSIELDKAEAEHLIAAGLARRAVEAAVAPEVETAAVKTQPTRRVRGPAEAKDGENW